MSENFNNQEIIVSIYLKIFIKVHAEALTNELNIDIFLSLTKR